MGWYEQTQSMMQTWAQAQQQMMQNWLQMGTTAQATPETNHMMDMWGDMVKQSMQFWTQNADPTVRDVSEQMFNSQKAMMRLLEMSAQVWQNMMPVIEDGDDWNTALSAQLEKVRDMLLQNTSDVVGAGANLTQLWQTYLEQWQGFAAPWMRSAMQSMPNMGAAMAGDSNALTQMTTLYWDAFQDTFGQMLQAPGIGYTREFDEKMRQSFAAWLDYQEASYEYQVMLADAWVKAFEELMRDMIDMAQQGQEMEGLRAFLNKWSATADGIFLEIFRSDAYVEVQSRLVNALMEYRIRQRAVTEKILELNDLPTRTEIDEAHRRIYELRKELKALKRQVAQQNEKPKTTRKRSSTKKATAAKPEEEA